MQQALLRCVSLVGIQMPGGLVPKLLGGWAGGFVWHETVIGCAYPIAVLLRPLALDNRLGGEFCRVDDDVLDVGAVVRVGDMHIAVAGLDDCGIGVLTRLILEHQCALPFLAVGRDRNIQRRAPVARVVVNEQCPAVGQHGAIRPGVGVRQ